LSYASKDLSNKSQTFGRRTVRHFDPGPRLAKPTQQKLPSMEVRPAMRTI